MKIVFRTDASIEIGSGHVMRCLTLADELRAKDSECFFICREHASNLIEEIENKGYHVFSLPLEDNKSIIPEQNSKAATSYEKWLGINWQIDAMQTRDIVRSIHPDWLVVDHYALDAQWESVLRKTAKKIMVIDDIADRQHDCDVLLDQNLYFDMHTRYSEKVPSHCKLLLGPRYALLRNEFQELREQITTRSAPLKRVLLFLGGVDADNFTSHCIQALAGAGISELSVDVVIGKQHPYRKQIEHECIKYGFTCYVQTSKMAELMLKADCSIGAGGSTNWERCCMGLPTILFAVADNQVQASKVLESHGAVFSELSDSLKSQTVDVSKIINRGIKYLLTGNHLQVMSKKAAEIVDGQGVKRVGDLLIEGTEK